MAEQINPLDATSSEVASFFNSRMGTTMKVISETFKKHIRTRPVGNLELVVEWDSDCCKLSLNNPTKEQCSVEELIILEMDMPYEPQTKVYGEGYNKLAQYSGTIDKMEMSGSLGDHEHYRFHKPSDLNKVYNMIIFDNQLLIGFSSCKRFSGSFLFSESVFKICLDLEGISISPNETIDLESLCVIEKNRNEALESFAEMISLNHERLKWNEVPTGWCSWSVYGPDVTEADVMGNLDAIERSGLKLDYIQIDDGYQPHMGDWLKHTNKFKGGVKQLCHKITDRGYKPAVWVAPFIAEEASDLFIQHPDWFVKDDFGKPLPSSDVSFGGWRCGPWYMLDGTHPKARKYLTHVFKTMREEWGVTYFKLDANMWGALPYGVRYKRNSTCVQAYRMGMEAIIEGAGSDSFILGCNAPMWPSLGLVHGMRITMDNHRSWSTFKLLASECFPRNWQNDRLWINDPDTVLLTNHKLDILDPAGTSNEEKKLVTDDEFVFNAVYTLASGGMVLSSDNVMNYTEVEIDRLKRLLPASGVAAVFGDDTYTVGRIDHGDHTIICIFNYTDEVRTYDIMVKTNEKSFDYFTNEQLHVYEKMGGSVEMRPHSARAIVVYS